MLQFSTLTIRRINCLKYFVQRAQSTAQSIHKQEKDISNEIRNDGTILSHSVTKKSRPPLVKNFFLGVVDKELLAYPEVVSREVQKDNKSIIDHLNDLYKNELANKTHLTPDLFKQLLDSNIFALNVSSNYGGKDLNFSSSLMLTEAECLNTNLALHLLSHRVVIDVLNKIGSSSQHAEYLPKLISGTIMAVDTSLNFSSPLSEELNTKADYDSDNKKWILNGVKTFFHVADTSLYPKLILVLAQTARIPGQTDVSYESTAFLIDTSKSAGIIMEKNVNPLFDNHFSLCNVKFKNVQVEESSILGEVHEGNSVAELLVKLRRLRESFVALGVAKKALQSLSFICNETQAWGADLM